MSGFIEYQPELADQGITQVLTGERNKQRIKQQQKKLLQEIFS